MDINGKVLYEAPATTVVEVKTDSCILTTSPYYVNPYYEE